VTTRRSYAVAATKPLFQSWSETRVRPWMCINRECRVVNRAIANQCEACETKKPVLQRWKCVECGTVNLAGVKQCKQCKAPAEKSRNYWMCADCSENNRVDEFENNSVCGFCGYDMAPRTEAQKEALHRAQEAAAAVQQQQESYDAISYQEADEQFTDPLQGGEALDPSVRVPQLAAGMESSNTSCRHLKIPQIGPFVPPAVPQTKHSVLHRRKRVSAAARVVMEASRTPEGPPGFDWMCRGAGCGHINPGDEENCLQCGVHISPAEWECPMCAALNHPTRARCFSCHTAIPVCWTCKGCGTATSIYDRVCRSCGVERPPTEPRWASEVSATDSVGRGGFTFQKNGQRGEWYCQQCRKMNFSRRTECFQCGTQRPSDAAAAQAENDAFATAGWGTPTTQQQAPLHNNWICTHCQASNFRTRHDCWKCGRPSEHHNEWSKETATPQFAHEGFQTGADDKSTVGQMNVAWKKDEDKWTCAKCYALNFKTRLECFRCGASKMAVLTPRRSKARRPVKL
jgi:hypothetical protein